MSAKARKPTMSLRVIDHELAHAWEGHSYSWPWGRDPEYNTLRFAKKFGTLGFCPPGTPPPAGLWSWVYIGGIVTGKGDRQAWSNYALEGDPREDFAETAAHMIARTVSVRVNS